jgi:DNA mismatch repair protein MutL
MTDIIQLLPDSVANQIAAGEVILRPASAVKELLENAIDAGATDINLIIKDAGKTLIHIVDNGSGMSERDARMSFERHATSKIKQANDLFAIRTLGFRGEALASIAAIAQVELKTKRHDEELGTLVEVEGSRVKNQVNCSCPAGTSIQVKNLFFNVPARRSFLKTESAELKHITDEFFRVALIYNDIRFTLYHNQKLLYQVFPSNRKQRIVSLFGSGYNERLVNVEHISEAISITGFIGKPEFARKSRGEQYFFVNGRYIRHPYLSHSIENAYRELIPLDSMPSYFIYIDTDPGTIDINIHPTKTEVNFLDSKVIYAVLRSAVRQALGLSNLLDSINFDVERSFDYQAGSTERPVKNPFDVPKSDYNPFEQNKPPQSFPHGEFQKPSIKGWEGLYDNNRFKVEQQPVNKELFEVGSTLQTESQEAAKTNVFQFQNRYIISSIKSGLVLIDQQRAHERIVYEQYLERIRQRQQVSQQELFPCQVSFSLSDADLLDDMMTDLNVLGFQLNKLGKNTFVVSGTPSGIQETDLQALLENFLEQFKKNLIELDLDKSTNLARSLASSLSVRSARKLFTEEMTHLIDELFSCNVPDLTPDGKKVYAIIPAEQVHQWLNR